LIALKILKKAIINNTDAIGGDNPVSFDFVYFNISPHFIAEPQRLPMSDFFAQI
jgi:hypothetical protein